METFETVNKTTLTNSKGLRYTDFRKGLKPRYGLVWRDILGAYAVLALTVAAGIAVQHRWPQLFWVTIPLVALITGYAVAGLNLFMHEASHYHIAPDKKQNDRLANIFLGLMIGMDIGFYRAMHMVHHRELGTVHDSEKSYFEALTPGFIIESLTGIRILKVLTARNSDMARNEGTTAGTEIIQKNNRQFFSAAVLHIMLVSALFVTGYWPVALGWMAGMGAVFPFFASFRQVLEHRRVEADQEQNYHHTNHGAAHRMFGTGFIDSTLGPAGFNRHLLHHWDPQVSYTNFEEMEQYLADTPLHREMEQSRTTYGKTFRQLLHL